MARYQHDYRGISADIEPPRNQDPNYRGGVYRGMRMPGTPSQAPYGWHRWTHAGDLGTQGGFQGRSAPRGSYSGELESGYGANPMTPHGYDWGYRGGGGVRDVRYDREFLRDFNANSPAFRGEGRPQGRYGVDYQERGGHPIRRDTHPRFDYANRGINDSGYTTPWAWKPMRGGR